MKRMMLVSAVAALVLVTTGCVEQDYNQSMNVASEAAQAGAGVDLNAAAVAVSMYLGQNGSLDGFTASVAKGLEPTFKWVDGGAAAPGVVSIRAASGSDVVLVTVDATGNPVCMAFVGGVKKMGSTDAQTPTSC